MKASERLKNIREDLVKTQKEMAAMLGVAPRTWQNYEEGIHDPSWKVIEGLVEMGFNANWILSGEGYMHAGGPLFTPFVESEWYVNERCKLVRGDMPLDEFAKKLGVYPGEIENIENNHTQPEGYFLSKICTEFNINPTWLLVGAGPKCHEDVIYKENDIEVIASLDRKVLRNVLQSIKDSYDEMITEGLLDEEVFFDLPNMAELIAFCYEDDINHEIKDATKLKKVKVKRLVGFINKSKQK